MSLERMKQEPIIDVVGLGKSYQIGSRKEPYVSLREEIMKLASFTARQTRRAESIYWALKEVSFSIFQGEAIGVIGRNGAGKSTLLKVLSRITPPTAGRIRMRGRVASLLEVGTGFHPELTGRENIFLNGAILGMTRKEIRQKFEAIVDFAEVEQFLETPVKRYSSGMYVRLAFAVAAHLEPEILIVDEVLAVGDARFQQKCLGKMGEVNQGGRTVIFVSHNMGMIASLCKRAILLHSGQLMFDGSVAEATNRYYTENGVYSPSHVDFRTFERRVGDRYATLLEGRIENTQGIEVQEIDIRNPFRVTMVYELHEDVPQAPSPNFHFYNSQAQCAFVSPGPVREDAKLNARTRGCYQATCLVPGNLLNNDLYYIGLALTFVHSGVHVSFWERNALSIVVVDPIDETLEVRSGYSGAIPGIVRPILEWEIRPLR